MALSEAEELELLELEEAEAKEAGQTPAGGPPAPADPHAGDSKTRKFVRGVANALPTAGGIGGGIALGLPGAVFGMGVGGLGTGAVGAGLGAAAGTAGKQMILRALGDTEGVPQTMGEAAKEIGIEGAKDAALTYGGGKLIGGAFKGAKLAKDLVVKPGAAEVAMAGKEALVDIAERGGEKLALARATKEAAKKGLISAEEKAGLHFESTPGFEDLIKNPKKMAEFSQKIGRLAKKTPEELAQTLDSKTLQLFRKVAQEGEKTALIQERAGVPVLSDISKAQLRNGKDVFTQALGIKDKGVGEALGRFRDADKVVGEIPSEIKGRLMKAKLQNQKDVLDAKSLDKKRKIVKGLAKSAAVYLGAKSLIK